MPNKNLVHNFNLRSELAEFRSEYLLNIPRLVDIANAYIAGAEWRVARPAPVAPVAPVVPRHMSATVFMRTVDRATLTRTQLLTSDTFLRDGACKPSLIIMVNDLRRFNGGPYVLITDVDSVSQNFLVTAIHRHLQSIPSNSDRLCIIPPTTSKGIQVICVVGRLAACKIPHTHNFKRNTNNMCRWEASRM